MNWKLGLVAVLVLVSLGAIGWWWWNRTHGPGADCLMLAHEKTSGIDFSFTVDKVKSLQATLGLTDKDVRDFDDLLKDYGAKYETNCKDFSALHVITTAEYNCRRNNMDKTLDSVRALREVLGKTSGDATNVIAKNYIDSILGSSHSGFKNGCGASMRISPNKIHISKEVNHTLTLSNVGNRDINFAVSGVPECLLADPKVGGLKERDSVNITLWRTYYAVSSDSFTFTIDDNFDDHIPVEVSGAANLPSPRQLAENLRKRFGRTPTLKDVLGFVDPKNLEPSAGAFVTASAILSSAGNYGDALAAIKTAQSIDPRLRDEASIQLQSGALHFARGDSTVALEELRSAQSAADSRIADTSRWFSGITLLDSGKAKEAASYICGDRGSAVPDSEMIGPIAGSKIVADVEHARTSTDCAASVSRLRPDFRRQFGVKESRIKAYEDVQDVNNHFSHPAQYDTKAKAAVYFASGSSVLSASDQAVLAELAKTATSLPDCVIQVRGHFDPASNAATNEHLFDERANAVFAYLREIGVPLQNIAEPGSIREVGQATSNEDPDGRGENRRVDVSVLADKRLSGH
jgi:outer membrane protein OmpA-like peptidoglycan-associated protein